MWFVHWLANVQGVKALGQRGVVVYKRGRKGRLDGLGYTQRGEVEELRRMRIDFVEWDIDEYMQKAIPYARAQQEVQDTPDGGRGGAASCAVL
mmetsp:Transcript_150050/g.418081  ORF Transcript_150050/g.418081 Transcript_150050/m.418081 type:complete len:93 (+) Transcript_150050:3-281(+)